MSASLTYVAVGPCAVAPCLFDRISLAPQHRLSVRAKVTPVTMTSQPTRRERASSDKAQAVPVPQRPGLPNRTISAPAGGVYRLESARMAMESGNKVDRTLVEEDENPSSAGGKGVPSSRDEVWFILPVLLGLWRAHLISDARGCRRPRRSRISPM